MSDIVEFFDPPHEAEEHPAYEPYPETLTDRQEEGVEALLATISVGAAAQQIGVSRTTIYRWLKQPAFAERLREARHEAMRRGIHRLHQVAEEAAVVLHEIMVNPEAPAAARVTAARSAITFSFEGYEIDQLDEKIEQINEAAKSLPEAPW